MQYAKKKDVKVIELTEKEKALFVKEGVTFDHVRVIDAEHFISLIKRDDFDYTVWLREYFDEMEPSEFDVKASAYAESHPYAGKAQIFQ